MLFYPGAEFVHVGGASHGGRMFTENLRGHLRFLAKHRGPPRPSARGGSCSRRCGCAACSSRASAGRCTATPRAGSPPARRSRCWPHRAREPPLPLRSAAARARRGRRAAARRACCRTPGFGLYLKLAAATLVVLLPGSLIARLLGRPSVSATLAWTLAGIFGAGAIVFAVHGSLDLALGLYAALGVGALVVLLARPRGRRAAPAGARDRARGSSAGCCSGTSRARSAATRSSTSPACASCSPSATCTCRRWTSSRTAASIPATRSRSGTCFLAFVARLSGVDAGRVLLHEASVLCPLAFAVVYESGRARVPEPRRGVRRRWSRRWRCSGSRAVTAAATSTSRCRRRRRGSCSCPVVIALFFWYVRRPSRAGAATLAAAGLALALVHPTYAAVRARAARGLRGGALAARARRAAAGDRRARRAARPGRSPSRSGCCRSSARRRRTTRRTPSWRRT